MTQTFCKFTKAVKEILEIKDLTEEQAKIMMSLYITRTSVEEAAKKLKEKMK